MFYHDNLYGIWNIPKDLKPVIQTAAARRLRGIAQSVFPAFISPTVVPSRFHHSLGVCRLASELIKDKPNCRDFGQTLLVAALLHDMASPPFSHSSEPFLRELTGHDGETFLGPFLRHDSELAEAVEKTGVEADDVLSWICGVTPLSQILNGYPDLDNLDNVARYYHTANLGKLSLNTFEILRGLVLNGGQWLLLDDHCKEVRVWERMRQTVYNHVYRYPDLAIATMLQRALYLAFVNDELDIGFFKKDETEATAYLSRECNRWTRRLLESLTRWEWHLEIFSLTEYDVSETKLGEFTRNPLTGPRLADQLCEVLDIPRNCLSVQAFRKRERKVLFPVSCSNGQLKTFASSFQAPTEYVFRVYADCSLISRKEEITQEVEKML